MSILTHAAIKAAIDKGEIVITPFDINCLGSNSYDVHLSKYFAEYCVDDICLDAKKENKIFHYTIKEEGYLLKPNQLYLATTLEYTETHAHVPYLEGKSSTGRLGIQIHLTAGKGDIGFCNYWTLEIIVSEPIKVYPGMPIGQIAYFTIEGENSNPYNKKENAKYNTIDPRPQGSKMFKNKW